MGLVQILDFLRLGAAKNSASSCELLSQKRNAKKIIEKRKSKRRSMIELCIGNRKDAKKPKRAMSTFHAIHTHHEKFYFLSSTNRWFKRNMVEYFVNDSAVREVDQKDCKCCPDPRSGHRIFATKDFIYLIGGYRPNGKPDITFTDVWRFNMLTEKWQKCWLEKGLMPDCLASFSLVQTDCPNDVYIFGGTGVPFGNVASNDLFKFCVNANGEIHLQKSIITGEENHKPPRIYGQAMCFTKLNSQNNKPAPVIYVVGGTSGYDYNIDVWKLQLSNNKDAESWIWESKLLTSRTYHNECGRYRLEVIFHQNQLITFGGGAPGFCAEFDELLTFDLGTETFVKLRTIADEEYGYPEGRKCHSIVQFKGEVYVIGGCREIVTEANTKTERKITNDVWKLHLATMSWTRLNTLLPLPVFFHSAAVTVEGCIFVFGGCTDINSMSRTNKIFRMWLRPPSLQHLAMKVVHAQYHYIPSQKQADYNMMLISQLNQMITKTLENKS